jgi:hypothetical protein
METRSALVDPWTKFRARKLKNLVNLKFTKLLALENARKLCRMFQRETYENGAPFAHAGVVRRNANGAPGFHAGSVQHYGFMKEPSVIVWLPPASIANTSNSCSPEARDATYSGETVTL